MQRIMNVFELGPKTYLTRNIGIARTVNDDNKHDDHNAFIFGLIHDNWAIAATPDLKFVLGKVYSWWKVDHVVRKTVTHEELLELYTNFNGLATWIHDTQYMFLDQLPERKAK